MSTPDDVRTIPSTDPAGTDDRVDRPDTAVPAAYRPAPDEEPGAPAVPGGRRRQPTEEKSRRKRRLEYPPPRTAHGARGGQPHPPGLP
ncbi:hypothetical protein [Citricoccus sp. CH26A]|uniref:hypothetical protein n=1 Tax=Citricoccus sp. CH26A TaxID=1045009 RepID=UPI000311E5F3